MTRWHKTPKEPEAPLEPEGLLFPEPSVTLPPPDESWDESSKTEERPTVEFAKGSVAVPLPGLPPTAPPAAEPLPATSTAEVALAARIARQAELPTAGRIVLYKGQDGSRRPAMVVAVHLASAEPGEPEVEESLDLWVFGQTQSYLAGVPFAGDDQRKGHAYWGRGLP